MVQNKYTRCRLTFFINPLPLHQLRLRFRLKIHQTTWRTMILSDQVKVQVHDRHTDTRTRTYARSGRVVLCATKRPSSRAGTLHFTVSVDTAGSFTLDFYVGHFLWMLAILLLEGVPLTVSLLIHPYTGDYEAVGSQSLADLGGSDSTWHASSKHAKFGT